MLVADDDPVLRESLQALLAAEGYRVATAGDGAAALQWLYRAAVPGLVLLDLLMPGLSGAQVLARLASVPPAVPPRHVVVMGSGCDSSALAARYACSVVRKPLLGHRLLALLERQWVGSPAP